MRKLLLFRIGAVSGCLTYKRNNFRWNVQNKYAIFLWLPRHKLEIRTPVNSTQSKQLKTIDIRLRIRFRRKLCMYLYKEQKII